MFRDQIERGDRHKANKGDVGRCEAASPFAIVAKSVWARFHAFSSRTRRCATENGGAVVVGMAQRLTEESRKMMEHGRVRVFDLD